MATVQNLSIFGADGPVTINCAILQDGAVLSLSGVVVTIYLKAAQSDDDADALVTYVSGSGLTITNSSQGLLNWVIGATDVPRGSSLCYHAVASAAGEVFTWAYGAVSSKAV